MSFWEIIDTILLKSLGLIFETVYMLAYKVIGNPGLSIIVLSLFMNFLVLGIESTSVMEITRPNPSYL